MYEKYCSSLLFLILPLVTTITWLTYVVFKPPYTINTNVLPVEEKNISTLVSFPARIINKTKEKNITKIINLSDTVAYVDMWRSHWCTYYNDREFYFTPRINEIAQRLRQFSIPVVDISMTIDSDLPNIRQRRRALQMIENGAVPELLNYEARQESYHNAYIPGFRDECPYPGLHRHGPTRDNRFTTSIALTKDDLFVQNFRESAQTFVGLGKKHVIVLGQHTNMCLMAVFLYCKQVGLDLIIVRDLVDTCWLYELQKNHVNTHTKGNDAVNRYFDKDFGCSVISYDLIRSLRKSDMPRASPTYNMFYKSAFIFKNLE